MSNRIMKNVWLVGWIAAVPVAAIALNSLTNLPNFFIMISAASLWLLCLLIAGSASRGDSLAAEERQELREARQQITRLGSELSSFTRTEAASSVAPPQGDSGLKDEIENLKKQIVDRDDLLAEQIIAMQRVSALVPEVELRVKTLIDQVENQSAVTADLVADVYQKARENFSVSKEISSQFSGKNIFTSGVRDLSSLAAVLSRAFQVLSEVSETFKMQRKSSEALTLLVHRLIGDTATMTKVADDIREISEQANLLLLNTTITLARGEGEDRGFNIVAEEVRKISDRANFTSQYASQMMAVLPTSLAKISESLEDSVNVSVEKLEAVDEEVQRLIGPGKLTSSVLAKLVSELISSAESIALNIDQISAGLNFQDQFRLAVDTAISPIRQIRYYADESIFRVASQIKSMDLGAGPAADLTSSTHLMSSEAHADLHNSRDAV